MHLAFRTAFRTSYLSPCVFVKPLFKTNVILPCKNHLISNFLTGGRFFNYLHLSQNVAKTTSVIQSCACVPPEGKPKFLNIANHGLEVGSLICDLSAGFKNFRDILAQQTCSALIGMLLMQCFKNSQLLSKTPFCQEVQLTHVGSYCISRTLPPPFTYHRES